MLPLWDGAPPLPPEKLEAFATDTFARVNAAEFVDHLKLQGKAGQRGMVWVVPVFKLYTFTLARAAKTDDAGQVTVVEEESVRFPLPVAARIFGLVSEQY